MPSNPYETKINHAKLTCPVTTTKVSPINYIAEFLILWHKSVIIILLVAIILNVDTREPAIGISKVGAKPKHGVLKWWVTGLNGKMRWIRSLNWCDDIPNTNKITPSVYRIFAARQKKWPIVVHWWYNDGLNDCHNFYIFLILTTPLTDCCGRFFAPNKWDFSRNGTETPVAYSIGWDLV